STWLTLVASWGASRIVGMSAREKSMRARSLPPASQSIVHNHARAGIRIRCPNAVPTLGQLGAHPFKERLCILRLQIDAAVTPLVAKRSVPKSAVKRVTLLEIHDPRDVFDRVGTVGRVIVIHGRGDVFLANAKAPRHRAMVLRGVLVVVAPA